MGLFSKLFGGKVRNAATHTSFLQTYSGGSGGWGLDRFNSIIKAHSSVEDIIEQFDIDKEGSDYDCYDRAYAEAMAQAKISAAVASALGEEVDPEDFIDEEEVQDRAHQYAEELVKRWLSGAEWIPEDVMDWAWYEVSDHNR